MTDKMEMSDMNDDDYDLFEDFQNKTFSYLSQQSPICLEYRNITYSVPQGKNKSDKVILSNVSGVINSGELTAIIGPSGAGKTALMNILAGYKTIGSNKQYEIKGSISLNGSNRVTKKFRKMASYIMQDDHIMPQFTLKETMMTAANLKLPGTTSSEEKEQVVKDIIDVLRLTDTENTKASNLSGGERKRLCIAQELVNNPPIMFFDEPTSGLDSSSCDQCISLLKFLARGGRAIVCTIHQPNSKLFQKFDKLVVIAEGQCIYRGPTKGMVPFLASMDLECPPYHNPADFVIDIASEENGIHLPKLANAVTSGKCDFWDQSSGEFQKFSNFSKTDDNVSIQMEGSTPSLNKSNVAIWNPKHHNVEEVFEVGDYATSFTTQFRILLKRAFLSIIRNRLWTGLRFATHVVIGALIGVLFFNIGNSAEDIFSNLGFLFCCIVFFMFTATIPAVLLYPLERNVIEREYLNGWYNLKAYYLAKVIADTPFQIINPLLFATISYWMTSQPTEWYRFVYFITFSIMMTLVGQSLGFFVGTGTDIQLGIFVCAAVNVPFVVFSGFFVTYYTMPIYLRWLCYLSYLYYGLQGLILAVYGFDRPPLDCPDSLCLIDLPEELLNQFEIVHREVYIHYIGLFVCFFLFRIASYFVLRRKVRSQI